MQVHCDEGAAIHIGAEPCVCIREDAGEASVGKCVGWVLSRERLKIGAPTLSQRRKATLTGALLLAEWGQDAPRKVATVVARWNRVRDGLDDNGKGWLDWFVDQSLQPAEVAAGLDVLAA